jgi:uncharacterized LabA/DUF88 family protein
MRVRIFVDFWNLQLKWNRYHEERGAPARVKIPWDTTLTPTICNAIAPESEYAGTQVYASIDRYNPADAGLRRFLNVMDGFTGYKVIVKDRKPASRVRCPECSNHIDECPHCHKPLRRMVEKGVGISMATDLITMSLDGLHDRAVIVTADADFVPAVEYLQNKGKKVTHLYFKPLGAELRKACWDHLFFDDLMPLLVPGGASAPPACAT